MSYGFNWWMQHNNDCVSMRSVADEAENPDSLHQNTEGHHVGALEGWRIPASDCPPV